VRYSSWKLSEQRHVCLGVGDDAGRVGYRYAPLLGLDIFGPADLLLHLPAKLNELTWGRVKGVVV
jgi:hypothetical protein